jgi:hypothetical protein
MKEGRKDDPGFIFFIADHLIGSCRQIRVSRSGGPITPIGGVYSSSR